METHFFASANTGKGFVNYFENLNTENGFVYVIKGGSGTGKSTMLKKVGEHFLKKGFDVEFVHCSTDTKSLDAVRICQLNVLVQDGTSPHTRDANVVGVDDRIVDVGEFVSDKISKFKTEIHNILKEKAICFKNFYKTLEGALKTFEVAENLKPPVECSKLDKVSNEIFCLLNLSPLDRKPTSRKLFFSAVQPGKIANLCDKNDFKSVQTIQNSAEFCNLALKKLNEKVLSFGYDTVLFAHFLNPEFLQALFVPATNTIVVSKQEKPKNKQIEFFEAQTSLLLEKAGEFLKQAKEWHFKLEEIFVQHTNFKEIDKLTKKLIAQIESQTKTLCQKTSKPEKPHKTNKKQK